MDKIYKTKYGTWIDLSHILTINRNENNFASGMMGSIVEMMFKDNPLFFSVSDYGKNDETKEIEAFDDLLQAWKDYNKQSNERKTNFIGKL